MFDTDFLGKKIDIGDEVIFEAPKYRSFCIGKVVTKAEKSCQIEYINDWNFPTEGKKLICRQYYDQIIKKPIAYEIEYAEWYYDPDGMDWELGAWKCSKCHTKNDNLGGSKDINPYMFAGSKFCPQCGAVMKPKEV